MRKASPFVFFNGVQVRTSPLTVSHQSLGPIITAKNGKNSTLTSPPHISLSLITNGQWKQCTESIRELREKRPYLTTFLPCISHVTTILISSLSKVTRELILFFCWVDSVFMGDNWLGTPPYPKSPPEYPDVCGKHRLKVAVQSLNEEIDFLKVLFTSLVSSYN